MHPNLTPKDIERFWSKVDQSGGPDACWPWMGTMSPHYGVMKITNADGRFMVGAHRLALMVTGVDMPDGSLACHHCDNKRCCNPAHLYVGTDRDNRQDAMDRGLVPARLTEADVIEARRLYVPYKMTYQMLADRYECNLITIRDAIVGKTWAHIPGAVDDHPGFSPLSEADVISIRQRYAAGGVSQSQIAREYGRSSRQISAIVRSERWTHLPSVEELKAAS